MRELLKTNRRLFVYLIVSNLLLMFGHRIWQTMFNNFAVEEIGVGPQAIGWIQSVREVPGLLAFLVAFLALLFSEIRIMALGVVFLGVGIVLTAQVTSVPWLLLSTLVMSTGFHVFNPSNNSVVLMSVPKERAPRFLGQLRSLGAAAAVLATGVVYLFASRLGYRSLFLLIGGLVIAGGLVLLPMGKGHHGLPRHRRIILRKRYWLFYTLAFLMGSRRHVFTTFAVFLLVSKHGISVETTAILFLVNALINTYVYQRIGRLVGRLGERLILSVAFATLIPVFLGYAYIDYLPVLYGLFVLDNILFGCNLALTTYLQKIAVTQEEITTNLSVQETINHISAVIVPVIGGTVWALFGSQAPFLAGVGIAISSLALVQFIRIPSEPAPELIALMQDSEL